MFKTQYGLVLCLIFSTKTKTIEDFHICTEFLTYLFIFFSRFSNWEILASNWEKIYFLALGMGPYFGPKMSRKSTLLSESRITCRMELEKNNLKLSILQV